MASVKLASLIIKTLSKPLAVSIKNQAKRSAGFKNFCIGIAQGSHRMEHYLRIRFLGYENTRLKPLNDAKAVDFGANFLSELLIFSVATLTILGETYRSSKKASLREIRIDKSIVDINSSHTEWKNSIEKLTENWHKTEEKLESLEALVTKLTLQLDGVSAAQNTSEYPPGKDTA